MYVSVCDVFQMIRFVASNWMLQIQMVLLLYLDNMEKGTEKPLHNNNNNKWYTCKDSYNQPLRDKKEEEKNNTHKNNEICQV